MWWNRIEILLLIESSSIQIESLTTKSGDRPPILQSIRIDVAVTTQYVIILNFFCASTVVQIMNAIDNIDNMEYALVANQQNDEVFVCEPINNDAKQNDLIK